MNPRRDTTLPDINEFDPVDGLMPPSLRPLFVPQGDCRDHHQQDEPPLTVQLASVCAAVFTAVVLIVGNGGAS